MRQRREEGQARMGRRKGAVGAPSLATRGRDWEMTAAKPREKKRGKGTRGREVVSSQKPHKPWLSVICPIRSMLREQRLIFVLVGVVINSLFFTLAPSSCTRRSLTSHGFLCFARFITCFASSDSSSSYTFFPFYFFLKKFCSYYVILFCGSLCLFLGFVVCLILILHDCSPVSVELKKQISCSLQLSNKIDSYVAFKCTMNEPRLDQSGEEHLLGTTCTELDSEKSWEVSVCLSKLGHHNALEVVVVSQGITYYTAADAIATAFRPPPIREIKQGPHHARAIIDQVPFPPPRGATTSTHMRFMDFIPTPGLSPQRPNQL